MQVWKYPLRPNTNLIDMPRGTQLLTVATQHKEPHLWALVDEAQPMEGRKIGVYGTGHPIPEHENLR